MSVCQRGYKYDAMDSLFAFSILANQSALSTSPFKLVLFCIQKTPKIIINCLLNKQTNNKSQFREPDSQTSQVPV